jgi:hypothetical protein
MYLLYPILAVDAKMLLENIMMILTSTSCIHLQKDDSFLLGSSGSVQDILIICNIINIIYFVKLQLQYRNYLVTVSFSTSELDVNILY